MKLFLAFFTLVLIANQCSSLELECMYVQDNFGPYGCYVQNAMVLASKNDREVTSVTFEDWGKHKKGKNDDDVKKISSNGKFASHFPLGITKFFKNIEVVIINWAELQVVTKEDLKQFGGNLKKLELNENKIERVDADLFEFNPNLEWIRLSDNNIKFIGNGAFDGLDKLRFLSLAGNPCTTIEDHAYDGRSKILKVIENVEKNCKE